MTVMEKLLLMLMLHYPTLQPELCIFNIENPSWGRKEEELSTEVVNHLNSFD